MNANLVKWLKTTGIAVVGGGVAGAFAAAMDPSKYHFPHDFGSGKLWKFFLEGCAMTLMALLIKSPLGQKVMTSFQQSQQQAKDDAALIASTKADLVQAASPSPPVAKPAESKEKP